MSATSRRLVEASQTLGAAYLAGLRPHARCLRGKRMGPVKVEPCGYTAELHFETLLWTKGAAYPCWKLNEKRLKCPRCGGMGVVVDWHPGGSQGQRRARKLYQAHFAAGDTSPDGDSAPAPVRFTTG